MRIAYWTTACLRPDIEAVSKEVDALANYFKPSMLIATNRHLGLTVNIRDRIVGLNTQMELLLRVVGPFIESVFDINHFYSEVSPWTFFRSVRRKPIVLTIASEKGGLFRDFLERCSAIVVQTEGMRRRLEEIGVNHKRITLIYPGVDLHRFIPAKCKPSGKAVTILLATFPRTTEEMEARGINFLLLAARHCPDINFRLIGRPWGHGESAAATVRSLIGKAELRNVELIASFQGDMASVYHTSDFTVIPYTRPDGGKECPLSLVESMACGIPVLISNQAPLSSFIQKEGAGRVFNLDPRSFAEVVDQACADYELLSAASVRAARQHFDICGMLSAYRKIYQRII